MTGASRRIRVVGISGAGKSRFAREAAARLGLPYAELDELFWDAGWQHRDVAEARARLDDFVATHPDGWVVDGNWNTTMAGRLELPDEVDLIVWLDHPRSLVMWRVITRTVRRAITREELWHGNRERARTWFSLDPAENIVLWSWTHYDAIRERYLPRVGQPGFVRLAGRREARCWLDALDATPPPAG